MNDTNNTEATYWAERRGAEETESIFRLINATGAKLSRDGDQWCYLLGDDLQYGVSGFGDTVLDAAKSFYFAITTERADSI